MKRSLNILIYCFCSYMILTGCEKEIHPQLDQSAGIIVVDAWITQKMERQEIRITRSQPYFENTWPEKINGAEVSIEDMDDGTRYVFREGSESYYWEPVGSPFGVIGHEYRLSVTVDGETFEAYARLGRVPPIDSVTFKYNEKDIFINQDYYTAEFMATDPPGVGDTYWIKAWKNGVFLGKPMELNMTYDAGFTPGQSVDGVPFNILIRKDFINPYDENPEKENEFLPPYEVGDSVYVEIHSLDHAAFDFLFAVYFHINRMGGFAELFSMPLANSPTNLKSVRENSDTGIAGFFNVAAVSDNGRRLTQELADEARRVVD